MYACKQSWLDYKTLIIPQARLNDGIIHLGKKKRVEVTGVEVEGGGDLLRGVGGRLSRRGEDGGGRWSSSGKGGVRLWCKNWGGGARVHEGGSYLFHMVGEGLIEAYLIDMASYIDRLVE